MRKKSIPLYASEFDLADNPHGRILVGGKLVYASTDEKLSVPADYVAQPPRPVYGSRWWSRFSKPTIQVFVHVHPLVAQSGKAQVGF
jgi:hypothetical protein